jgi:hypothetical protein
MIDKRNLLVPALALLLTECTDTLDSITRDLRNANNEAIDAMMMVTSEEQAHSMNTRVLKPLRQRYGDIEFKLKAWESNRDTKKQVIEEITRSNGVALYVAELEINRVRFTMEKTRLRNLYKQYQERRLDEMRAAGDNNPIIAHPRKVCPELHDLIMTDNILKNIETQLTEPKLKQMVQK